MKHIYFIAALIALTYLSSTNVSALAPSFQPTTVDLNVQPGSSDKAVFRIVNPFSSDLEYTFKPQIFTPTNNTKTSLVNEPLQNDSLSWISTSPNKIVIAQLSYVDVIIDVNVPKEASIGNYYIYLAFLAEAQINDNGTQINTQFGPVMFLRVGNDQADPQLQLTTVPSSVIYDSNSMINFVFSNVGNAHAIPQGVVNIMPVLSIDSTKKSIDFNIKKERILSGYSREISQSTGQLLGIYDVQLVAAYGPTNTVIEQTTRVLFIPMWLIYLLVVVFVIVIVMVVRKVILRRRGIVGS